MCDMSVRVKEEVLCDVASPPITDVLFSNDNGNSINVPIKQENELIISEQTQEHQFSSTQLNDEDREDQTNDLDYQFDGYAIKFLDQDENDVEDDTQFLSFLNEGEETNDYSYKSTDDTYEKQSVQEDDYKYRRSTESYKKIIDLQNCNYILILCPICEAFTRTFRGWTNHLYSKHPDCGDELKMHYSEKVNGKAVCKHCSLAVQSNVNHYLHYYTKHCPNQNPLFQCAICQHKVLTPFDIVKHLDEKHDQFNDLYRKCPVCGEVFTERKHMREHFRDRHHNEFMEKFNFMCHLCKHPRFSKETHLYEHLIKIHHLCEKDWESDHFRAIDDDELKFECLKCHTTCHVTGAHTLLKHHLEHEDNCCWFCKFCFAKCKFSEPMHLCNKMYKHFLPHASKHKGKRSRTQDEQIEHSWREFEDYILHCCPYCDEEYQTFQEWQVHMREQHFTNTLQGLKMSLVENDIRKLRCLECETLIETSFVDLYSHCFLHLPYKPYKCRRCLILLDDYQVALKHCLNKCQENKNPLYFKEDQMFMHKLANDASNSIIILCFACRGKQFSSAEAIEAHFKTHHNNFEEHFIKDVELKKMVCNVCRNSFDKTSSSACLQHYVEHLGEGPFKCVFCQRSYVTYERCRIHVNRYHNSNVSNKTASTTAPKKTPRQSPKHVPKGLGVGGEKSNILNEFSEFISYACPECDERFTTVISWSQHIQSQHTFFQESNLSDFDSAQQKHKCRECNIYVSSSVSQRQKHKLTHMPNKAFVCTLCGTRTTTTGLLYSHFRRLHFSEGDFECPICSVSLNNAYERSVHVIKTHPRSEWPENMCLICYRNYTDLRSHMYTHDTDRPKYNCPICNVAIIYWKDLQFHVKKKHNQSLDANYKLARARPSHTATNEPHSLCKAEVQETKREDEYEKLVTYRTRSMKRLPLTLEAKDQCIVKKTKTKTTM